MLMLSKMAGMLLGSAEDAPIVSAPAFGSFSESSSDAGSSVDVAPPTGNASGNILVAVVCCTRSEASATGWTPPAGWTERTENEAGVAPLRPGTFTVFTKLATGAEGTQTFDFPDGFDGARVVIVRYTGTLSGFVVGAISAQADSGESRWDTITTTVANARVLGIAAASTSINFVAGSQTERTDHASVGARPGIAVFDFVQAIAGAVPTAVATSGSSAPSLGVYFALQP